MLDIVNIAHPAFILLGSYVAFIGNTVFGIDPILAAVIAAAGSSTCSAWWPIRSTTSPSSGGTTSRCAACRSSSACCSSPRSALVLTFGVDYRSVQASYIGPSINLGLFDLPLRLLVPFLVGDGDGGRPAALPVAHLRRPRHPGGGAGPGRAPADGGQPGQDQAHRLRPLDRHGGAGRRLPDHHPAGRAVDRPRVYRPRLRHRACWAGWAAFPAW